MKEEKILSAALYGLYEAAKELMELPEELPVVPLPRERKFLFAPEIIWPGADFVTIDCNREGYSPRGYRLRWSDDRKFVAQSIVEKAKNQPRSVLRALRRIQAATAWCYARAEGRKKQAEEVLRQQSKAVEALEAEAALLVLEE